MSPLPSIGIIGTGWVGSSTALSILHAGICGELLLNDVLPHIAEGEAMDFNHGMPFLPSAVVRSATIDDMHTCTAIVVTAGRGGRPGETRLQLLQENIAIARDIGARLQGYQGLLIVVANPVDVLTWYYRIFTGMPGRRVIGTGTFLDTARLRQMVAATYRLDPKAIQADVIGEHGDSSVPVWSRAAIGGVPLRQWKGWSTHMEEQFTQKVRRAAQEIISRKGATNHAIGLVTATLLKWLLRGEHRVVAVSSCTQGAYGIEGLALSLPTVIGRQGIVEVLAPPLDEAELTALLRSAQVLRKAVDSVKKVA
jgi:L-lactate dehydrogenase